MASGIDVKMGVSGVSQFKSAMNQSSQSVKTLDAALKLNEKQLQATGDKETYMQQKSKLLQQQIAAQSNVVKQGQAALQAMEKNGVDPASAAYQKLQQQVLNAQTALLGMQTDLGAVGQTAADTAQQTDALADSLNSINKKVSFDAVIDGIGKITDGMEAAAGKVVSLVSNVWDAMASAAGWADDLSTRATMYGLSVTELQEMENAARIIDTSVETIIKARQNLKISMNSGKDAFAELGVSVGYLTGKGNEIKVLRDWEDVFWDVGDALMHYQGAVDRDVLAQEIFGKSWMELMSLFEAGREEYEEAKKSFSTVSEENVDKLAELDDALQHLEAEFETLKMTVLSSLAPAFTDLANSVSDALKQFNEYLDTDEGKEKLQALSDAVERLFSGIADVDFSGAVEAAAGFLDGIKNALDWIHQNWGSVVAGIKAIGWAFLGLKGAEILTSLAQGVVALKSLAGGGSAAAAGGALLGNIGGTLASVSKFALTKGLPIAGGLTLGLSLGNLIEGQGFTPIAKTSGNDWDVLYDENGNLTSAGKAAGLTETLAEHNERMEAERQQWWEENKTDYLIAEKLGHAERELKAHRAAIEKAEKSAQDLMDFMAWVEDQADQAGAQAAAEAPEDRLAHLFGFSDDQSLIDAYEGLMQEVRDANAGGSGRGMNDVLKRYGLSLDDWNLMAGMYWDAYQRVHYAASSAQALPEAVVVGVSDDGEEELSLGEIPVTAMPELPENADKLLQEQLSGVTLHVTAIPYLGGVVDGQHANGLPFVPFDGYIAALHRGERIVPANQNRSYTTNSNVYFDHVNVGGGVDADGLAARIAERTRRAMSGFGG